ncbi:MAG: glycosyltransferase family 4 protein [Bacteroidetes bacterium]|nr:glycosyltransferase family 4 protein [Bacteroidota bacterium]
MRNRQLDGIGNFTVQVLQRIIKNHPEQHFDILVDKKFENFYFDYPNVSLHRIFPALRHPLLYILFLEIRLPLFLKKLKPDLVVAMDGFLSLASKSNQLPVVYDLNFEHYPENLPWRNRVYYRFFFPRFVRKSSRVITISEYSKDDIIKTYHYPAEKIDNVYCGISEYFYPCSDDEKRNTMKQYAGGNEYYFFAGTMHPRKNIVRLIEAFIAFKQKNSNKVKLVLAGHIMWDDASIRKVIEGSNIKDDVVLAGRVSNETLRLLLGSARALVFVPVFEGFGLPVVEAWQCGAPVICSNVTSLPEVAGDAAIVVDPFNVEQIAGAMQTMMDDSVQQHYIEAGNKRKQLFSWKETAGLFWEAMQRTIKNNG